MRFSFAIFITAIALLPGCNRQNIAVSGTIEVDEVHVASRSPGRVEKIFAWEGDTLKPGDVIVQLEASEMQARRELAAAQINTAQHDV
jgi:HlyD family secretion protein